MTITTAKELLSPTGPKQFANYGFVGKEVSKLMPIVRQYRKGSAEQEEIQRGEAALASLLEKLKSIDWDKIKDDINDDVSTQGTDILATILIIILVLMVLMLVYWWLADEIQKLIDWLWDIYYELEDILRG